MGTKRSKPAVLDHDQMRFIEAYLAGAGSIDRAAEQANLSTRTCERWMQPGHRVRAAIERQLAARERLFDAVVALAGDPKATASTRLEAYREAMRILGLETVRPARAGVLQRSPDLAELYAALAPREGGP
jgi:hypothetical protein